MPPIWLIRSAVGGGVALRRCLVQAAGARAKPASRSSGRSPSSGRGSASSSSRRSERLEAALAVWVLIGAAPLLCAVAQTALLVTLNAIGLLWARHVIHDPGGMVVKNLAFLVLAWVAAALPGPI